MKAVYKEFDEANPATPLRREITPKSSIPTDTGSQPIIDFRSSDQTVDRYNEIVVPAGMHLENYRKNPVVQNAHSYWSILDTIGKSIITEVRGTELFQRVLFATEVNPLGKIAYGLYKGGFLNAVSIGFIPKRWENGSQEVGYRRKYLEAELLEVSAVGIPANPNALKLGFEQGAVEKSDLQELAQLLKSICTDTASPGTDASAPSAGTDGAHWLHAPEFLTQLRSLLR